MRQWIVPFVVLLSLVACGERPAATGRTGDLLRGERALDLGDVAIKSVDEHVAHVFHLLNTGDLPVQIADVKSSCGCLKASVDRATIEPSQSVAVTVDMALSSTGKRSASAWLILEEGDPVECRLSANVVALERMVSPWERAMIGAGGRVDVPLLAIGPSPAPLEARVADGWTAELGPWRPVTEEVWRAVVTVTAPNSMGQSTYGFLRVKCGDTPPIKVGLWASPEWAMQPPSYDR